MARFPTKSHGILIFVVCIFAVSMVQSLRDIQRGQSIAIEVTALDYWNASQARFELERVIGTLDGFAAGIEGITRDDVLDRVDIFWSRLPILYEGDQSRDIVELTNAEVTAPAIMDRIDRLRGSLETLDQTDRDAYVELRQVFQSFQKPIQDIVLRIHHAHGIGYTTLSRQLEHLYTLHSLSLSGALVSGIILIILLVRSIGSSKRAQRSADEARVELEAVMNALPLSVDVVDRDGRFLLANACALDARGIRDEQSWFGQRPDEVGQTAMIDDLNQEVLSNGQTLASKEIKVERPDHEAQTWLVSKVPLLGRIGDIKKIITVGVDITEQKAAECRIRYLAHHDALTGLPNRAYLQEHLAAALGRCERQGRQLALLSLDFDRFKEVNDRFGHEAGDRFLIKASDLLKACMPPSAVVARLGGDEFAVVQECVAGQSEVQALAVELLHAFKEPVEIGEQHWFSTVSIGATLSTSFEVDQQLLMKHADLALYEAKEKGGNAVCFYDPAMRMRHRHRFGLQQDLRAAIVKDDLALYYQPKIRLLDGKLTGFEALLRWRHPTKGAIEPSVFIPAAEDCDLIDSLGEWVLNKACAQLALWLERGFDPPPIAINLSAAQFLRQDMASLIKCALDRAGIPPSLLELEVTESVLVEHSDHMRNMLSELQALQLGITLDDFGTGYSSLSYLQSFPIDKIKIDKSFVQPISRENDDTSIIRAIIAMAHSLDITVVAEGVETEEQRRVLEAIGCEEIQGFLIGHALPPAALAHWKLHDEVPAMRRKKGDVVRLLRQANRPN